MKLNGGLTGQRCCRKVRGTGPREAAHERESRPARRPAAQTPHQAGRGPVRGPDRRDRPAAHRGARRRRPVGAPPRPGPRRRPQLAVPVLPDHGRPDARHRRRTHRPYPAHLAAHRGLARRPAGPRPAHARGRPRAPQGRGAQLVPGDRAGVRDPGRRDHPRRAAPRRFPRSRRGADLPRLRRPGPRARRPRLGERGDAEGRAYVALLLSAAASRLAEIRSRSGDPTATLDPSVTTEP